MPVRESRTWGFTLASPLTFRVVQDVALLISEDLDQILQQDNLFIHQPEEGGRTIKQ
jgi:hypothetical protein